MDENSMNYEMNEVINDNGDENSQTKQNDMKKIQILNLKMDYSAKAKKLISKISEGYQQLLDTENRYMEKGEELGVEFNKPKENDKIMLKIQKIIEIITKSQQEIGQNLDLRLNDNNTEIINEKYEQANKLYEKLIKAIEESQNLDKILIEYKKESNDKLNSSLYQKTHDLILDTRLKIYQERLEEVESEKIGIFGALFGKDKLKREKLKNLNLKIKLAEKKREGINYNKKHSIKEMIVDMIAFSESELDGRMTKEMADFATAMVKHYHYKDENGEKKHYTMKYINKLIQNNQSTQDYFDNIYDENLLTTSLPEVKDRAISTKSQLEDLKRRNSKLRSKIAEIEPYEETYMESRSKDTSIHLYMRTLNAIGNTLRTSKRKKERVQIEEKEQDDR